MTYFNSNEQIELHVRDADGRYRMASPQQVLAAARVAIDQHFARGELMSSPEVVRDFFRMKLAGLPHEVFVMLVLDSRHRIIDYVELFRGTVNVTSVYPREVVKETLARNGGAVILAHCHPSGVPEPSASDRALTQRLKDALALLDIRVLDHIIVAGADTVSFAELGTL